MSASQPPAQVVSVEKCKVGPLTIVFCPGKLFPQCRNMEVLKVMLSDCQYGKLIVGQMQLAYPELGSVSTDSNSPAHLIPEKLFRRWFDLLLAALPGVNYISPSCCLA